MSDAVVDLFEIQEKLRQDTDSSARREIESALASLQQSLKRQLDAGAAPDDFKKLNALAEAANAAAEVVAAP